MDSGVGWSTVTCGRGNLWRSEYGLASDFDVTRITVVLKLNVTAAQIKPVVCRMLYVLVIV